MDNIVFISDISNNLNYYYKKENYEKMFDLLNNKLNTILINGTPSIDSSLNEDVNVFKVFLRNKIKKNINTPNANDNLNKAQNIESTNQYIYIYYFIIIKILLSVIIILFLMYYTNYYNIIFNNVTNISNRIINKK
tara:strand:+ start:2313 stop:2720 length:408 start_codon:yes stop_codon:yes gene_type:complete